MNRNLMIVVGGGFLIAVLVAMLVQAGLSGKKAEPEKQEPPVKIAVASKDLAVGAELSDDNLRWQDWPKDAVFPGAVVKEGDKKPVDMIHGRVRRPIAEGEPVVESALIKENKGNFVAASLGEGMRAVAIETSAAKMAGGFIAAGDYVDVILTYKDKVKYTGPQNAQINDMIALNLDKMASETILQNVRVLAVDQTAQRVDKRDEAAAPSKKGEKDSSKKESPSGAKVGKTVTLEVDRKGAEVLALAGEMGDIHLALRKLGDSKIYDRDYAVVSDARLVNIARELYGEMVRIQNASGQNNNIVRIYDGGALREVAVGQ